MMRSISLILITVLFIITAGCKSEKESISKLWFYTHSSRTALDGDPVLTPASFLLLRPDGSFTRDFGRYEFGSWKVDEKTLTLNSQDGKQQLLPYKINGVSTMQVSMSSN